MSKYKIIQVTETEEKELYFGENCFIYYGEGTNARHIRPTGQMMLTEKKWLKQAYLDTVMALKKMYSDYIGHVIPHKILVEVDMTWELTEKTTPNSRWEIDIRRATGVEHQYTGADYVLKLKQWWLEHWEDEQIIAAIFSQLLRVHSETGAVRQYRESYHSVLTPTLGEGYLGEHVSIPNILKEKIVIKGFQRADKQVTIDEKEAEAKEPEENQQELEDVSNG